MRVPWKFYELTHRRVVGSPSFNVSTGAVAETTQDNAVSGYIVPSTPQDISKGFQVGSYKCFAIGVANLPIVKQDKIVCGTTVYTVRNVRDWVGSGLYELELIA